MITVTTFPQQQQQSTIQKANPDYHGWPNGGDSGAQSDDAWPDGEGGQGYWHGAEYNPYIEFKTFSDGTRYVDDCLVGTYSKSYYNGNHQAHVQDGYIDHVVMQRGHFTGGSHNEGIGGSHDKTVGLHSRTNIGHDHYENIGSGGGGVHHSFFGGGAVSIVPGNQIHVAGGSVMHSAPSGGSSWGAGHGGGGQQHDRMMGMSDKGINIVDNGGMSGGGGGGSGGGGGGSSQGGNINIHTSMGKKVYIQNQQGDITNNATKGNHTTNAQNAYINGKSGVQINGPGTQGSMQIPAFKAPGATFIAGMQVTGKGIQMSGGGQAGDQSSFSPSGGGGSSGGGGGSSGGSSSS